MMYHGYISPLELYSLETGWETPPNPSLSTSRDLVSAQGVAMCDFDSHMGDHGSEIPFCSMGTSPWASVTEASTSLFNDTSMGQASRESDESFAHGELSMSLVSLWGQETSGPPLKDQLFDANSSPTPASMASNWFPSPATTPGIPHPHQPPVTMECSCFNFCVQSFQDLHNVSGQWALSLDAVLSLNRNAVESCKALLSCPMCTRRPGASTTVMFVATILSKVAGFLRTAVQMHLDGTTGGAPDNPSLHRDTPATARQEAGWLEPETLAREMDRLREVCSRFRDVCADLPDDAEVNRAMVEHVGRSLGAAMDTVKKVQAAWYS